METISDFEKLMGVALKDLIGITVKWRKSCSDAPVYAEFLGLHPGIYGYEAAIRIGTIVELTHPSNIEFVC